MTKSRALPLSYNACCRHAVSQCVDDVHWRTALFCLHKRSEYGPFWTVIFGAWVRSVSLGNDCGIYTTLIIYPDPNHNSATNPKVFLAMKPIANPNQTPYMDSFLCVSARVRVIVETGTECPMTTGVVVIKITRVVTNKFKSRRLLYHIMLF